MELEGCDYRMATGLAVLGTPTPIDTVYHDAWNELLNPKKTRTLMPDKDARKKYDSSVRRFQDASTHAEHISFGDVPWPCDGDAEDMVAVMLTGEETPSAKIKRSKELALFWHPDKFLSRYSSSLRDEDRESIIDGVLDISKEITRCLERGERKNLKVKNKRLLYAQIKLKRTDA